MQPSIVCRDLSKSYITRKRTPGLRGALRGLFGSEKLVHAAVKDVNLEIYPGEVVGYIGPNGAGKSTTIKMLVGILCPTAGTVAVNGLTPFANRMKLARTIGVVMGQRTQLWWDLPVRDSFELFRELYEIDPVTYTENVKLFTEMLDLGPLLNKPVRQLSLGQRVRCDLAIAFLHNPSVVFLDEPTIGLDAVAKQRISSFLRHLAEQRSTTILMTSHDLEEIDRTCDRVVVLNKGQLVYDGGLPELKANYGHECVMTLELAAPLDDAQLETVTALMQSLGCPFQCTGLQLRITVNRQRRTPIDVMAACWSKVPIRDMKLTESPIEEMISRIYLST
jgi:ABC-2 type transport system ATP-binding protein